MTSTCARSGGFPLPSHCALLISTARLFSAGNVKALHAMHPPEFRLRVGDWRVRFHDHGDWIDVLRIFNRREGYR